MMSFEEDGTPDRQRSLRTALGAPKLSPVLREIAPQAEQIFRDQYVMEFLGGKEYEHENGMKTTKPCFSRRCRM